MYGRVGYPPLVTPFSQYVKNLAMMNVMAMEKGKERWGMIADDIWDMLLGKAGRLPGTLAPKSSRKPNVKDVNSSKVIRRTITLTHSTSIAS